MRFVLIESSDNVRATSERVKSAPTDFVLPPYYVNLTDRPFAPPRPVRANDRTVPVRALLRAASVRHPEVESWVKEVARELRPEVIHWCDGSVEEVELLSRRLVAQGQTVPLSEERHPRSLLHRSHPSDVARTENLTFICSEKEGDAGPTNNWMSPEDARAKVWPLFQRAMVGRTLYVVPYFMGPAGSPYARVGVELTDSAYVALSLRVMTRMGEPALFALGRDPRFVRGIHTTGDLSPDRRFIVHFPEQRTIWSVGSGYGGNALLSKKCHALRIASVQARDEGWLAEHMMIIGLTSPSGEKHYIAAAFPSACGKTNLAMLSSKIPGWKVETIGDDICWMHVGSDGRLWAINPEAGFFGVAPGTSAKTNPNAIATIARDTIFTNVALRANGSVWWEGLCPLEKGEVLTDWRGETWTEGSDRPAAHPNARFTVAATQCPSVGHGFVAPTGVPISAILFGGRQAKHAPLVCEARDWAHGVYMGATLVSETTAAATGAVGVPRHDPIAMLPFCGYNMGDYFGHWLSIGRRLTRPPRIFQVNWFRTGADGRYLWPGFGENLRVLRWVVDRVNGRAAARETAIGNIPAFDSLDTSGLDLPKTTLEALFALDIGALQERAEDHRSFLARFGDRLPSLLAREDRALRDRLRCALS
jgi:phosphoenolpyruvate carboxykinase (GTP)